MLIAIQFFRTIESDQEWLIKISKMYFWTVEIFSRPLDSGITMFIDQDPFDRV